MRFSADAFSTLAARDTLWHLLCIVGGLWPAFFLIFSFLLHGLGACLDVWHMKQSAGTCQTMKVPKRRESIKCPPSL
jgi:hypothetical protein